MDNVTAQTFLFQPPVARINMYHHGYKVALKRREGVTFGTVTEPLKKMSTEDEQYFRQLNKRSSRMWASCPTLARAAKHTRVP